MLHAMKLKETAAVTVLGVWALWYGLRAYRWPERYRILFSPLPQKPYALKVVRCFAVFWMWIGYAFLLMLVPTLVGLPHQGLIALGAVLVSGITTAVSMSVQAKRSTSADPGST
jgi:hypothetical protein